MHAAPPKISIDIPLPVAKNLKFENHFVKKAMLSFGQIIFTAGGWRMYPFHLLSSPTYIILAYSSTMQFLHT